MVPLSIAVPTYHLRVDTFMCAASCPQWSRNSECGLITQVWTEKKKSFSESVCFQIVQSSDNSYYFSCLRGVFFIYKLDCIIAIAAIACFSAQ